MRSAVSGLFLTLAVAAALVAPAGAQTPQPGEAPDPSIADGSAQRALDRARDTWQVAGIRSYRFRVRVQCFCGPSWTRWATVTVRRGKPVKVPRRVAKVATVPRLFARIQEAIDLRVAALHVTYGARGLPRTVAIDVSRLIADEEASYRAARLRVLG